MNKILRDFSKEEHNYDKFKFKVTLKVGDILFPGSAQGVAGRGWGEGGGG